jgi:hypothetical protein
LNTYGRKFPHKTFFSRGCHLSTDDSTKNNYLKKALYAVTFTALPESTFLSSIMQVLEACLEACSVAFILCLKVVMKQEDCGCVRRETK